MVPISIFVSWREQAAERLRGAAEKETILQDWLEGYNLPPLDSYTEGNAWLLEAAREVPQFAEELAPPAVILLQAYRTRSLKSESPERLSLNLFYLCAGLRNPSAFWQPLWDLLEDRAIRSPEESDVLGRYRGVPVVMAFRAALTENQRDHRLKGVWRLMLGEHSDYGRHNLPEDAEAILSFLKGGPMDGFEGILGLPGEPNEALLGWALAQMARELDDAPFREKQFAGLLDRVESRFNTAECNWHVLGVIRWQVWAKEVLEKKGWLAEDVPIDFVGTEVEFRQDAVRLPAAWVSYGPQFRRGIQVIAIDSQRSRLRSNLVVRSIKELANRCERKKRFRQ